MALFVWMVVTALAAPEVDGVRLVPKEASCAEHPLASGCGGDLDHREVIALQNDARGEHWRVATPEHAARLATKRTRYDARVERLVGREPSADRHIDPRPAEPDAWRGAVRLHGCGSPPTDTVPDGQGGCKMVFGNDNRVIVDRARTTYPHTKHVSFTLGFGPGDDTPVNVCSGTFLDADHVLTAAHCLYDTGRNVWLWASGPTVNPGDEPTPLGVDEGMGYVCRSGWIDDPAAFEAHCEFVDVRWVDDGYVAAANDTTVAAVKKDYAILRLRRDHHPDGLGVRAWIAISEITAARTYQQKMAVVHAYPGVHPPGEAWNWVSRSWSVAGQPWEVWGARQYRSVGPVDGPTTRSLLRSKYDCSPGMSGAAIFYYTDDATEYSGQAHYIIGVHAADEADNDGSTSDDHCVGPTARQFRDWAIGILP